MLPKLFDKYGSKHYYSGKPAVHRIAYFATLFETLFDSFHTSDNNAFLLAFFSAYQSRNCHSLSVAKLLAIAN